MVGAGCRCEWVIGLRAAETVGFMTARWAHLLYELLEKDSNRIINEIRSAKGELQRGHRLRLPCRQGPQPGRVHVQQAQAVPAHRNRQQGLGQAAGQVTLCRR